MSKVVSVFPSKNPPPSITAVVKTPKNSELNKFLSDLFDQGSIGHIVFKGGFIKR